MDSSLHQHNRQRYLLTAHLNLVKNEYILLYRKSIKLALEELIFSLGMLQQNGTGDRAALCLLANAKYAEFRERSDVLCTQLRECRQWEDTLTEALEALKP